MSMPAENHSTTAITRVHSLTYPACTISSSPSSSTVFSLPVGASRMNLSPISMEPASAALFWPAMASWICLGEMPVVARRAREISR